MGFRVYLAGLGTAATSCASTVHRSDPTVEGSGFGVGEIGFRVEGSGFRV